MSNIRNYTNSLLDQKPTEETTVQGEIPDTQKVFEEQLLEQ